jgi:putative ABC transport system substrate-binding protein
MRRRDFIALLCGTAAAWPLAAHAQRPKMPVIGVLYAGSVNGSEDYDQAFRRGLAETGYGEDRNVAFEYRWADGLISRLPGLAADLVRRQVSVIVTGGSTEAVRAAIAATSSIPIVFSSAGDPVAGGIVASLNRPGANRTGVVALTAELVPKRLEMLHEVLPSAGTISVLLNPSGSRRTQPPNELQSAARGLGLLPQCGAGARVAMRRPATSPPSPCGAQTHLYPGADQAFPAVKVGLQEVRHAVALIKVEHKNSLGAQLSLI